MSRASPTIWTDTIRADRISIIEWLGSNDRKTGKELTDRLKTWKRAQRIEFYQCGHASEVLSAIQHVTNNVSSLGVPILHVEAHGAGGPDGGISDDVNELLTWRQLRIPLRALNIATRFQLLVVGAACYGEGFLWGIGELAAAPFLACVGFPRTVIDFSVGKVMLEFYRALLIRRENVEVAVESALREAHDPQQEFLRFTTVRSLLVDTLRRTFAEEAEMSPKQRFAQNVGLASAVAIKSKGKIVNPYAKVASSENWSSAAAAKELVSKILAFDLFPENRARFQVNVRALMREARQRRDLPDTARRS